MSTEVIIYPSASAYVRKSNPDANQHNISSVTTPEGWAGDEVYLLLEFPAIGAQDAEQYKYKGYSISTHLLGRTTNAYFSTWRASVYNALFTSADTVTFNSFSKWGLRTTGEHSSGAFAAIEKFPAYVSAKNQIAVSDMALGGLTLYGSAAAASNKTYIKVLFDDDDATLTPYGSSPTGGWVDRRAACTFSWRTAQSKTTLMSIPVDSFVFRWKESGAGSWTEVSLSGSTTSYTIPANTMPAGEIQWQVEVEDGLGGTGTSNVYTITTEDTEAIATPASPINTIENGDSDITLRWTVTNASGNAATRSDIQTSNDGSTWSDLTIITGSGTEYEAPAGTFQAETVYWRVRAYNADSVAGAWSEAVSFLSVAAPPAPVVSADDVPFITVSWQSSGQLAWKLLIDGEEAASDFGTDTVWKSDDYLQDGEHEISVYVQGAYGLWSKAGTYVSQIANQPGSPVELSGNAGIDAELAWQSSSTTEDWLIYRDGVRIGHTSARTWADQTVLGSHVYEVINRLPDGNLSRSNALTLTSATDETVISAFPDISWLRLNLDENSDSEQGFSYSREHSLRHFCGAAYPVLEQSPYENETATYTASFADLTAARMLEALHGKPVIIKSRRGNVVIGVLAEMQKSEKLYFASFVFRVTRIYWEDYRDDTGA